MTEPSRFLNGPINALAMKRFTAAANGDTGQFAQRGLKALPPGVTMQFLKTLFWIVIAVSLAIFASNNWSDVTLNLWGNLQADIKLPVLLLILFLLGFLPTYFLMRGRLWAMQRKLILAERPVVETPAAPVATVSQEDQFA